MRSKIELMRFWKRLRTDCRAEKAVEKMPWMRLKKEEMRSRRPSIMPIFER